MIKNLLFAATAFVALSLGANAQTVVWSDGFDDENEDVSDWTLIDSDEDGIDWMPAQLVDQQNQPVNSAGLISYSYVEIQGVPYVLTPDNWAVSPIVSVPELNEGEVVKLKWKVWAPASDYADENYSVYASASSDIATLQVSDLTFTELVTDNGPGGVDNIYQKEIDISALAGGNAYVAFRHHNVSDQYMIVIDDVEVVIETAGSTDNFAKLGLNVFPNPVSDIVNITSPEANIEAVTITDLNGRTVKSINFNNVAETTVDASDLASGIYLMNITANGTVATQKIVKK